MTLSEILNSIANFADEALEIPAEVHDELKTKIDSYYEVISFLQSESERYSQEAAKMKDKHHRIEKNIESLYDYIQYTMNHFGWKSIKGLNHSATLVERKVFKLYATNPQEFIGNDFVKQNVTYEFDKDLLKKRLETESIELDEICGYETKEHVRIK